MTLTPAQTFIALIDVQPYFFDSAQSDKKELLNHFKQLLIMANWMSLPLVATFEEPTQKKGHLIPSLEEFFPQDGVRLTKNTFDCCREEGVHQVLEKIKRKQVVVAGSETDVCVMLSCLGFLQMGFQVFLLEDCVFSSKKDVSSTFKRLYQAGVIPLTLKTMFYELTESADKTLWPQKWQEGYQSWQGQIIDPDEL